MTRQIQLELGGLSVSVTLNDSESADKIWQALPFSGSANTWGEEIYFEIPVKLPLETGYDQSVVELGAVGYWPPGSALCLFFGQTPASTPNEIRPASAVNLLGTIDGDCTVLKQVADGTPIQVSQI